MLNIDESERLVGSNEERFSSGVKHIGRSASWLVHVAYHEVLGGGCSVQCAMFCLGERIPFTGGYFISAANCLRIRTATCV
jgi:hypothetical protein